jgi:hypothetical protein
MEQAKPSTRHDDEMRLGVGPNAHTYADHGLPFDPADEVTVLSAVLRYYVKGTWSANPTLTAKRITEDWTERDTWQSRPAVTGTGVTATGSALTDGSERAFDVTTLYQQAADGADWYGLRVEAGGTELRFFHSPGSDFPPTLDITWTTKPDAPTGLSPSGGRSVSVAKPVFRWDPFTDPDSDAMTALQVQIDPAKNGTDPAFDSRTVTATETEFDSANTVTTRTAQVTTTSASTAITAPAGTFAAADVGQAISGTGIPAGATIAARTSDTTATLSVAATASGTVTATIESRYLGLSNGNRTYWRPRHKDASGQWSPWGDWAAFRRDNKGTLTINNPAAPPNNFVTESTPPLSAVLTGETQTGRRILIVDPADPTVVLHDTEWGKTTATDFTPPKRVIAVLGKLYRLIWRVFDSKDREATPGDPAYTEATRDFTFNLDTTVAPVTNLAGQALSPRPWYRVTAERATAPDSFNAVVDGKVVESGLLPSELLVSGTQYGYTFKETSPNRDHDFSLHPVVNGKTAANNPTVAGRAPLLGIWIHDPERNLEVYLTDGRSSTWGRGEVGEWLDPLGAAASVYISQALRGAEGRITDAHIRKQAGRSAEAWTADLEAIRNRPGRRIRLSYGTQSYWAVLSNIVPRPWTANPDPAALAVDFDFRRVA